MSDARSVRHAKPALELKIASKALVRAAGGTDGSAETINAVCHASTRQQRMSDVGLPNTADFLRLDEIGALEDVTAGTVDHPVVTRALARRQGFFLVRSPQAPATGADLLALLGAQARESGQLAQAICAGLGDGRIDRIDAGGIRGELRQLMEIAAEMDAELALIEGETR